ncbi:MAG: cytochrome P460 family protein [Elusimicrobiota bacterium]|nr:cytochrome P460 family protein [Elusimicrobiota bacterium]
MAVVLVLLSGAGFVYSGNKKTEPAPNGISLPAGFEDWRLVSVSLRADNNTIRAILGNKTAMKAARSGKTLPWPDGTILAKMVWKQKTLEEWPSAPFSPALRLGTLP